MRFVRMLVVVLVMSLGGGLFGATLGALVGYGFPSTVRVEPGVEVTRQDQEQDTETEYEYRGAVKVGVGAGDDDTSPTGRGASLGAAIGLFLGAMLGIPLALLDQFMVSITDWMARRRLGEGDHPPGT